MSKAAMKSNTKPATLHKDGTLSVGELGKVGKWLRGQDGMYIFYPAGIAKACVGNISREEFREIVAKYMRDRAD